jgi:hypothetical protein
MSKYCRKTDAFCFPFSSLTAYLRSTTLCRQLRDEIDILAFTQLQSSMWIIYAAEGNWATVLINWQF